MTLYIVSWYVRGITLPLVDAIRKQRLGRRPGVAVLNAPDGQFGVLYCGSDPHCAFIETFCDTIWQNRTASPAPGRWRSGHIPSSWTESITSRGAIRSARASPCTIAPVPRSRYGSRLVWATRRMHRS